MEDASTENKEHDLSKCVKVGMVPNLSYSFNTIGWLGCRI